MSQSINRRQFLQRASLTAAGVWAAQSYFGKISPNEKLNIAAIGTANRAAQDIGPCATENIVALCDVDATYLAAAKVKYPGAKTYTDFRKMLEQNDIDAVIVGTPDHMHAPATVAALKSGRHVYCEKPLTHTVSEARIVAETAKKHGLITQMGNQIHATNNYHKVVETIKAGVIGQVHEVHVFVDVIYTANGRPTATPPVPATLDWDLWLGPAEPRPYSPEYVPAKWRNYWEFGGGTMSDFGCHYMDLPFWALDLRHPTTVETEGPPVNAEGTPIWMNAHYTFPERGNLPAVKLYWYCGQKDGNFQRPHYFAEMNLPKGESGVLFVGEKGMLLSEYMKHTLLPENKFADRPTHVPGNNYEHDHHQQWIHAIKTGGKTLSNFDYAGALTEAVLLANASYRSSSKINWDGANLKAINNARAEEFIQHHYRKGWSL